MFSKEILRYFWPYQRVILAVCFTGEGGGAGAAAEAWKRRRRGGAVQKKHSLALVRGWFPDVMGTNCGEVTTSKAFMLGVLTSI